jgi:hypothetical protein
MNELVRPTPQIRYSIVWYPNSRNTIAIASQFNLFFSAKTKRFIRKINSRQAMKSDTIPFQLFITPLCVSAPL